MVRCHQVTGLPLQSISTIWEHGSKTETERALLWRPTILGFLKRTFPGFNLILLPNFISHFPPSSGGLLYEQDIWKCEVTTFCFEENFVRGGKWKLLILPGFQKLLRGIFRLGKCKPVNSSILRKWKMHVFLFLQKSYNAHEDWMTEK